MVACVYKTLVSSYNLVSIIFTEGLLFSFEILYSSLCSYKELQNLNDIYRIVNSLNSLLHASLQPKFNFFSPSQLIEEITFNPSIKFWRFFYIDFQWKQSSDHVFGRGCVLDWTNKNHIWYIYNIMILNNISA